QRRNAARYHAGVKNRGFHVRVERRPDRTPRRRAQFRPARIARPRARDRAEQRAARQGLKRKFGALGFLGVNIDQRYGGGGQGSLGAIPVLEEFAKIHPAIAFPVFESCVGPIKVIERYGTQALRDRIIPAVCKGEHVVAVAMSEPSAGTALTDLTTKAHNKGD